LEKRKLGKENQYWAGCPATVNASRAPRNQNFQKKRKLGKENRYWAWCPATVNASRAPRNQNFQKKRKLGKENRYWAWCPATINASRAPRNQNFQKKESLAKKTIMGQGAVPLNLRLAPRITSYIRSTIIKTRIIPPMTAFARKPLKAVSGRGFFLRALTRDKNTTRAKIIPT